MSTTVGTSPKEMPEHQLQATPASLVISLFHYHEERVPQEDLENSQKTESVLSLKVMKRKLTITSKLFLTINLRTTKIFSLQLGRLLVEVLLRLERPLSSMLLLPLSAMRIRQERTRARSTSRAAHLAGTRYPVGLRRQRPRFYAVSVTALVAAAKKGMISLRNLYRGQDLILETILSTIHMAKRRSIQASLRTSSSSTMKITRQCHYCHLKIQSIKLIATHSTCSILNRALVQLSVTKHIWNRKL